MDSHGAEHSSHGDGMRDTDPTTCTDNTSVRRVRGATMMSGLIKLRAEGVRTKIIFDERDNPVGTEGKKFQSYLGTQAHTVPIDIQSWKHVPREVKDRIWETILVKLIFNL